MYNLNSQQEKAVTYSGKHLLVMAGAGTGKTRTIIARARYLIESGVSPAKILILSFTRKSALEIVNRIKAELNQGTAKGLRGVTFHSWCMDLIRNNPKIFAMHDYTLIDEEDQESCIKLLCGKNLKDSQNKKVTPGQILHVYSYCINSMCSLSESMRVCIYNHASANDERMQKIIEENKELYANVIKHYLEFKRQRRYLDYDDLLQIVALGLSKNTVARNYISSAYEHILVDEMQDTNPLQYKLLSNFYDNCHLFCVGDEAQSIYAFRGADFKTMHNFKEIVPCSEVYKLTENYRSNQQILDLSNWLINQSPLNYDKDLHAVRGNGGVPQIIHWESVWEEANDVTDKMIENKTEHGYLWIDNLVLSRSINGLRTVEGCCIEKKIPYKVYGGTGLLQSRHIRDLVSAMRIVANYQDEIAWTRYLLLWRGIGEGKAAKIIERVIVKETLQRCLEELGKCGLEPNITDTLNNLKDLQSAPSLAIKTAMRTMGQRLSEIYKEQWEARRKDFNVLESVAQSVASISEFIAEYVLDPKLDTRKKGAGMDLDHVILSTIHSAKGLEAKACYVLGCSTWAYPTPRAIENGPDAIEEERRCLYVALTRAKDDLYIYRDIKTIHVNMNDKGNDENNDEEVNDKGDNRNNLYFLNDVPEGLYDNIIINQEREYRYKELEDACNPINDDFANQFDFN